MIKVLKIIATTVILLVLGFSAGFSLGRSAGFETGSEWALLQADIYAREAGVFMPVYLDGGKFRVVLRQPRNLYKRAWELSDRNYEQTTAVSKAEKIKEQDQVSTGLDNSEAVALASAAETPVIQ